MRSLLGPAGQTHAANGPPKHKDELIIAFSAMLLFALYSSSPASLPFLTLLQTLASTSCHSFSMSKHCSSPFCLCCTSFFLHLPLPIFPIYLSCSVNPPLPPLQRAVLMCNADPLYLTGSRGEGSNEERRGKMAGRMEARKEGLTSHSSFLLMSYSAVFEVNIFTAPLITRTSGTALPTLPAPPHRKIKYSYGLPPSPSSSLHYPVCLTPTSRHFYFCRSHWCFFAPSHVTSPYFSSHISLSARSWHSVLSAQVHLCHVWVTLHMQVTHHVRVICTRTWVFSSRFLTEITKEQCNTLTLFNVMCMWWQNKTDAS